MSAFLPLLGAKRTSSIYEYTCVEGSYCGEVSSAGRFLTPRRFSWRFACHLELRWRSSSQRRHSGTKSATVAAPTSCLTAQASRPASPRHCAACNRIRRGYPARVGTQSTRLARRPRSQRRRPPHRRLRHPHPRQRPPTYACRAHRGKAPAMQAVAPRQPTPGRRAAIRTACQPTSSPAVPACSRAGRRRCNACKAMLLSSPPPVGRRWPSSRRQRPHPRTAASGCGRTRGRYRADPTTAAAGPTEDSPISAGAEQISLCGGIPAGGGRLVDCLVANQASISPGCRRALLWASSAARGF